MRGLGALLALLEAAWAQPDVPAPQPDVPAPLAAVDEAWAAGGCALCHEVPGQPRAARQDSCADCHAWIRTVAASPAAREKALAVFPLWERYERNTHSYLAVPSLSAAMARLEPAWIDGYLQDPHDLRPAMPEGMPRFSLSDAQRAALVAAFAQARVPVAASPAPDPARLSEGERLFTARGCVTCHSMGPRPALAPVPLAPDLATTRQRMDPDTTWAWIADPGAVSPQATMPSLGLPPDEVTALRDFVLLADVSAPAQPAGAALPAPVDRPVAWAEVEAEVFGKICVHCHMDPAQNGGRRGPGNAGGFGWQPTGIELQTWEGVVAVADRIPDALLRRRQEAARDVVHPGFAPAEVVRPERPGMPLGLPPLTDEQTALVLAWIAQGTPR